jgi:hypothetical protein
VLFGFGPGLTVETVVLHSVPIAAGADAWSPHLHTHTTVPLHTNTHTSIDHRFIYLGNDSYCYMVTDK